MAAHAVLCNRGLRNATEKLAVGAEVTASCVEGDTDFLLPGPAQARADRAEPRRDPESEHENHDDVGLACRDFVINGCVKIHPKALLNYDTLDASTKALVGKEMKEFYPQKIVEGVATLAAASVQPKRIIVRMSDCTSTEYKRLVGGDRYEPDQENLTLNTVAAT